MEDLMMNGDSISIMKWGRKKLRSGPRPLKRRRRKYDTRSSFGDLKDATGAVRPPNPDVTTKAITGGPASVKPLSNNRSITTISHASHRLHFSDFSKQNPKWEISPAPLVSPRIWPKLVSINGKIYAFGGNLLTDNQSPFAEILDGEGRYFVGPISGLEGEDHRFINTVLKNGDSYPLALLPISPTLLGLLWCYTHYAVGCLSRASTLHITILKISRNEEIELEHTDSDSDSDSDTDKNPVLSLTASAIACLCFPILRDAKSVIDAYLIDDNKESWNLMSSCYSYCKVDDESRY
ncbi:hypothetical protein POM88_041753 [Heracleum sosnowskyi]|uniref:Uncharacterized protein n=1 Tax=Heracleum sosnowskyi TaxID=360622 RepID=A0AAD8HHE9_9APIA|nr:hypothetical protein POM88_041753 [Heracleum sosnowskyi]